MKICFAILVAAAFVADANNMPGIVGVLMGFAGYVAGFHDAIERLTNNGEGA
jgi:hypothetical protein